MKRILLNAILVFFVQLSAFSQEWVVREIGVCPNDKTYGICVGKGRNDNINRIYVSTRGEATDGAIYEWTYQGSAWVMTATVATGLRNLTTLAVGPARNDGINRLYAVEWGGATSRVFEYTWSGTAWTMNVVESPGKPMLSCTIGDARGDGITRLYVAGWIIHREYTWNGSGWNKVTISLGHGAEGPIAIAKGRNDNVVRYYTPGNHVKEFTWTGSNYSDSCSVSQLNKAPETVVVADVRNNGVNRVYTQDNSGTYEYTWNGSIWQQFFINGRFGRSFLFSAITKNDGKRYIYNTDIDSAFREYRFNPLTSMYDYTNIDAATGATALIDVGIGRNDDTVRLYTPRYANGKIYEITNVNPYVLEIPPVITGNNMLCPDGAGELTTGIYESYQWYRRYYGSTTTDPIEGAVSQTLTMDYYNFAASYISVEVSSGGNSYMSAEFFVDGYAFLLPTVATSGEFTVGTNGEAILCEGDVLYFTLNEPYTTNIVWYLFGTPIPGQTSQQLEVSEPGEYYVEGAPAECPDYIQGPGVVLEVVLCDPNGISDHIEYNLFKVYPNPAQDKLNISIPKELLGSKYVICDQSGKIIVTATLINEKFDIDVTALKSGAYFFKISDNSKLTVKFTKN